MSQDIGSVGTAYVELQADLSALAGQFSQANAEAGQAGEAAGLSFSRGMGQSVNLSPVAAQLSFLDEPLSQVAAGAEQMGLAFHDSEIIAVSSANSMAAAVSSVAPATEVARTGIVAMAADLESSRSAINRFGTEAQNLGMILSIGVTLPLAGLAAASIQAYASMDSLKRGLTAVTGSAEEAQRQFEDLKTVALLPGLDLTSIVQGATRLQAFGFTATEAKTALQAFGNAIASVGGGPAELNRVIVQLGQMAGAGKILTQDLRPIIEQVPQVAAIIKATLGSDALSDPEKALEKLGLTSKQYIDDMLVPGLLKLPQVSGGIKNDMVNMSMAITQALAQIGESLAPTFHTITEVAVPAVQLLVYAFTSLPGPIQSGIIAFAGLAAAIGPTTYAVGFMTKGFADVLGMLNLATNAMGLTGAAADAVAVSTTAAGTAAAVATPEIAAEAAAVEQLGLFAETGAAELGTFTEAEAGAGAAAAVAAGSSGGFTLLGVSLTTLGTSLATLSGFLGGAFLGSWLAQMQSARPPVDQLEASVKALGVNVADLKAKLADGSLTAEQYATHLQNIVIQAGQSAGGLKGLAAANDKANQSFAEVPKVAAEAVKAQGELRKAYADAQAGYQTLLAAQAQGTDVAVALVLAHDKLTAAFKALNPQIAENEKAQKAATEALKADSEERNKQDQLLLTAFDQKKKALTDLEAAQKEATQAGRDDIDFSAQLQVAKDNLKAAFDRLNLAVQQNYVEQLAANNGTKQASDVQEKQTDQIGKLQQATVDYTKVTKDATQQQILHQIALTGSFNTVQNGITIFHDVGQAMQDAAKAGTLTWAEVQKSIISVRDSLVTVPSAIDGVTASIEVMRGQGVQKIQTLADTIGGLKAAFLSVSDALNGTSAAVPQWVLNNTVAIVNGVHVVSDAAKALFANNTALAQSQEKVAGAQQQVNTVMVAGQAVMVSSNTVTSSATTAAQDLATAAQQVAAGFTQTGNASGAAVAGINKVASAAASAKTSLDALAWSENSDPGASMDAPINGAAGVSVTTDRSTVEATAIAHPGTFAFGAAAQMQYDDYIAAQEALGAANLAAAATIDTNTASVTANSAAVAGNTKQADAATPTLSDMTDQLWRLVDAGQGGSTAAADLRAQIAALQTTAVVATNAYTDATAAATSYGTAIQAVADTTALAVAQTVAAIQTTKAALGIVAPTPTVPVTAAPSTGSTQGMTLASPSTWYTTGGPPVQITIAAQTAAAVGQQVTMMLRSIGMN